jgi:hypothetical protein
MVLQNKKRIISLRLRQLVVTISLIAVLGILFTTTWIKTPIAGFERSQIAIFFTVLYVLFVVYHLLLNLNYIFFSDEGPRIILRYYSVRPFSSGTHSVEIPKSDFIRYEVRRRLLFRHELILFVQFKKGIGKYPAISLSALSRVDRKRLLAGLDTYLKR